jgi:hypothetical protein
MGSCLLGVDRSGFWQKALLYALANVVLHVKLVVWVVYHLDSSPSKMRKSASFSYFMTSPVVNSCDVLGFPAYPAPIGVAQIHANMTETYQDFRVTVCHDFGSRDYDTKRGKVWVEPLLCVGLVIRNVRLCCGLTRLLPLTSRNISLLSIMMFGFAKTRANRGPLIVWSFLVLCLGLAMAKWTP